jgi:hypothetical protein
LGWPAHSGHPGLVAAGLFDEPGVHDIAASVPNLWVAAAYLLSLWYRTFFCEKPDEPHFPLRLNFLSLSIGVYLTG